MFQFPGFAQTLLFNSGVSYLHLITGNPKPHGLVSHIAVRTPRHKVLEFQLSKVGFPIRKSVDQSFFAAPHGLSQRSTSFIASQRQGIHRTPLRHLIALIINVHTLGRMHTAQLSRPKSRWVLRGRTLIRKTSLLRRSEPIARRSSFANKDHLQLAIRLATDNKRRNDPGDSEGSRNCLHDPTWIDLLFTMSEITQSDVLVRTTNCETMFSRTTVKPYSAVGNQTIWWSQTGSNRRPHACKARALPAELWPRNQKTNAAR